MGVSVIHQLSLFAVAICSLLVSGIFGRLEVALFLIFELLVLLCYTLYLLYTNHTDVALQHNEIKRFDEKLATMRRMIMEWDVEKTEFVSIASHQLRTPLSIIRGYLDLLETGAYGDLPVQVKDTLGHIEESNDNLIKLVDSLLYVAGIEQSSVTYYFNQSSFCELAQSVEAALRMYAKSKDVEMVWEMENTEANFVFDTEKIRHVLFNLIENAIKYSTPGSRVWIKSFQNGSERVCTISDNGFGFEPEEAERVFDKFYRAKGARIMASAGTGLGLYIARHFVEAHHGKIWAYSRGVEKGSEFGFSLPLEQHTAEYKLYSDT